MTLKFENPGYVYILSNESLKDLKIGYTQNSPYDRSFDLFTTGVPTPFFVEKYWFVEDAMLCEELIHTRLTRFRTNESREFFRVDLEKAVMASMQAMDELRERLWAKNAIKQNYKATPAQNEMPTTARTTPEQKHADEIIAAGLKPLVVQQSYNNPKFTAMMKSLKESRRMLTTEEIAKAISISSKGVDALVRMMQKEGAMLYIKEEEKEGVKVKKYAMSLSFNVHQLKMLAEKFPDLDLMSLEKLFEKPVKKNESGYRNTNSKPTYQKKPENIDAPKPAQPAPQKVATPAPQAATPQPRAAAPAAQQASRTPQQQRQAGERSQSPAAFIQQKLEQEKQQSVAVQHPVPAAPAKPLTLKEEFMKLSKETYKELVASGKIKETQSVTRKPIKP